MCHHGLLYYSTTHPARHPNLDINLLEAQMEALRRVGIKTPIYLSVQCNEYAANEHPEWVAMDGLTLVKRYNSAFKAGWYTMDMSSPYQEFFTEIYLEVVLTENDEITAVHFISFCPERLCLTLAP